VEAQADEPGVTAGAMPRGTPVGDGPLRINMARLRDWESEVLAFGCLTSEQRCWWEGDFPTLMVVQEPRVMGYPPPGPSEFNDRRAAVLTFTEAPFPGHK